SNSSRAQLENVWVFGQMAGVDFNTNPPSAFVSAMRSLEGCASVCDENGALLFYTDGTYIWNRNQDTMPNGRHINPIPAVEWSGEWVPSTFSTTQAAVIVPRPKHHSQYYVFSLTAWEHLAHGGE